MSGQHSTPIHGRPQTFLSTFLESPLSSSSSSHADTTSSSSTSSSDTGFETPSRCTVSRDLSRSSPDPEISIHIPSSASQHVDSWISEARRLSTLLCGHCSLPSRPFDITICSACDGSFHSDCVLPATPRSSVQGDESALHHLQTDFLCHACAPLNLPVPEFSPPTGGSFWGAHSPTELHDIFKDLSHHTSTWTPNLFLVPYGTVGRNFIDELTRLISLFCTNPSAEPYALSAAVLAPTLLLQKPKKRSKASEHIALLERRLTMWLDGDFDT